MSVQEPAVATTTGSFTTGTVEAIHIAPARSVPVRAVTSIRGEPGIGLDGDRYGSSGDPSGHEPGRGKDLTLIEGEAIDALARDHGITLTAGETRRQVTTRGISLNELVGRRFRVGELVCVGVKLNEPCAYLQDLVGKPILAPLVHRGGLRADILVGGTFSVGDPVAPLDT